MPSSPADPDAIAFEVAATLEDHVRYNEFLLTQPEARRPRTIRLALGLVVYPLIGLFIGFCIATLTMGETPTLHIAFAIVKEDPWTGLLLPWLVLVGTYGTLSIVFRILRRPLLRMRCRRLLKERVGIEPTDRDLTERVRCIFGQDGYTAESPGYTHHVPWAGIKSLRETPDLLLVMTGVWFGYLIPKRDVAPEDLIAIRALAAHQLDPNGSRKVP